MDTFARLHPRGFYVTETRAYPFNAHFGLLGTLRVAPPPRFPHERVFVYSRPPLKRSDELVVFRQCADIGAAYEVRRTWECVALSAYDSSDDGHDDGREDGHDDGHYDGHDDGHEDGCMSVVFADFGAYYDALARGPFRAAAGP